MTPWTGNEGRKAVYDEHGSFVMWAPDIEAIAADPAQANPLMAAEPYGMDVMTKALDPATDPPKIRRNRKQIDKDERAVLAIAAILEEPIACKRSELAANDRETIARISDVLVEAGRL